MLPSLKVTDLWFPYRMLTLIVHGERIWGRSCAGEVRFLESCGKGSKLESHQ